MNGTRYEFFSCARFPRDENRSGRRRDLFDECIDLADRVGVSDELAVRATILKLSLQEFVLAFGNVEFYYGVEG